MLVKYINTKNLPREKWLELRKKGIGGSDAGAILGLNPYSSAYRVYADKLNLLPEADDNEAMRQGRDFEDYVAKRFCEIQNKKVRRCNKIIYHDKYPFIFANVDRLIIGEDAGLECKTASQFKTSEYMKGNVPAHYYCQCQHYMAVTGLPVWYLCVLVFQREPYIFKIERDEDEIDALIKAEVDFWNNNILAKKEPPATAQDSELLNDLYPDADEDISFDMMAHNALLEDIMSLKKEKSYIEKQIKEKENIIKQVIGESEYGHNDHFKISWKNEQRTTVDREKLKENFIDAYDQCKKISNNRILRIKEI